MEGTFGRAGTDEPARRSLSTGRAQTRPGQPLTLAQAKPGSSRRHLQYGTMVRRQQETAAPHTHSDPVAAGGGRCGAAQAAPLPRSFGGDRRQLVLLDVGGVLLVAVCCEEVRQRGVVTGVDIRRSVDGMSLIGVGETERLRQPAGVGE